MFLFSSLQLIIFCIGQSAGFVTVITSLMNFISDVVRVTMLTPTHVMPAHQVVILYGFFDAASAHFPQWCACITWFKHTEGFLSITLRLVACVFDIWPECTSPKVWNGCYFESTTLKAAGLFMQLGHGSAECLMPTAGPVIFTVIHVNSLHNVNVTFCGCSKSLGIPRWHQLMCIGWFPSTTTYPETCATFQTLWQCQLLTLCSKLSTFQFYDTLSHLTDGTGLSTPWVWVCYPPFSVVADAN